MLLPDTKPLYRGDIVSFTIGAVPVRGFVLRSVPRGCLVQWDGGIAVVRRADLTFTGFVVIGRVPRTRRARARLAVQVTNEVPSVISYPTRVISYPTSVADD